MKQQLSEQEFERAWHDYWNQIEFEFFKCETLATYNVDEEDIFLKLFREKKIDELRDALEKDTFQQSSIWSQARKRGFNFLRVHVFEEPLSEYLTFELEAYHIQARAGEAIWMVPKERIDSAYRDDLNDFMLFDRKNAIIVEHDSSNQFVAAYKMNEKENIEHLTALKNNLLDVGIPLADF